MCLWGRRKPSSSSTAPPPQILTALPPPASTPLACCTASCTLGWDACSEVVAMAMAMVVVVAHVHQIFICGDTTKGRRRQRLHLLSPAPALSPPPSPSLSPSLSQSVPVCPSERLETHLTRLCMTIMNRINNQGEEINWKKLSFKNGRMNI